MTSTLLTNSLSNDEATASVISPPKMQTAINECKVSLIYLSFLQALQTIYNS